MKDAEDRAWEVVRRAYEERPRTAHARRALGTFALRIGVFGAAALVVAAASSPGRAVFQRVRQAVGVEQAAPALFSLPAKGDLLVVSAHHGGVWLVRPDGFKRKLGPYDDASWSPHGRFVVATRGDELIALDPDGNVRWSLARPSPARPAWEGTDLDTRIAYLTPGGLRVVAGDGTGDHLLDASASGAAPAWDPARLHTVAYARRRAVVLREASGRTLWRAPVTFAVSALRWSSDGKELAAFSPHRVVVLGAHGRVVRTISMLTARFTGGAFRPRSHDLALELVRAGRSEVRVVHVDEPGTARLVFAGPGTFGDLAWAPDGSWLLVSWPAANQWVFVRGTHVHAVANIREQFPRHDGQPVALELAGRWCCGG